MSYKKLFVAIAALISLAPGLTACNYSAYRAEEVADRLAAPAWLIERKIPAGRFMLYVRERMHERYKPATIYIEGDGPLEFGPYQNDFIASPQNPLSLHLATRDRSKNLAYLARPCQYESERPQEEQCNIAQWTDQRFGPEVISAYKQALDDIKLRYDISGFHLVGYGGGAAVAALIASEREDILSLRSVAGNLNTRLYTDYHDISRFHGSLNPLDIAHNLTNLPQVHFVGGQDEMIPPVILHSYLQELGATNCVKYKFIQEAEHGAGWVDKWPDLLQLRPACEGPPITLDQLPYEEFKPVRITREGGKGVKGK